ncbi:MAG: flagellar biosynthetic protein FliO [Polyangiaceae bacterium]
MIRSSRRLTAGLIAGALTAAVTALTGAALADNPAPTAPAAAPEPPDPVMNALAGQPQEAPADPAIAAGPPAPPAAQPPAAPLQQPAQGTPLNLRPAPAPFGAGQTPGSLMPQLALVALIGAAGLWMWKRRASQRTEPNRAPRILARTPVGVRSELLVVEVDGQQMLIGVTPQTIQRIAVLSQINVAAPAGNVLIQDLPDEPGFRSLWNDDTLRDVEPPRPSYPAQSLAEAAARMNAMARSAAASRAVAAGSSQSIPKARTIKGAPLPPESGTHRVKPVGAEVEEQARGLLDARGRR